MCFTESWLQVDLSDSVVSLIWFLRADQRMAESGKRKGGGLTVFMSNR